MGFGRFRMLSRGRVRYRDGRMLAATEAVDVRCSSWSPRGPPRNVTRGELSNRRSATWKELM